MAAHRNRRERLSFLATAGLVTVSLIGFANVYSYSNADSFLGLALTAQGAHTLQVMVSYAVDAAAVVICGLLVIGNCCRMLGATMTWALRAGIALFMVLAAGNCHSCPSWAARLDHGSTVHSNSDAQRAS